MYLKNYGQFNHLEILGINKRTEKKLNKEEYLQGDLAKYPYHYLKRDFGVLGIDMHLHANGIDQSKVRENIK